MHIPLLCIGIMTGNSLDAVDMVLTRFAADGMMSDLIAHSVPFPRGLADSIRALRVDLDNLHGDLSAAEQRLRDAGSQRLSLSQIHDQYLHLVSDAVFSFIEKAKSQAVIGSKDEIDLIGFHGQTLAHCPPSIARKSNLEPYTIQMGNGQALADTLGIAVAYDFRSDDIAGGGEGAPLAPQHHRHLAEDAKRRGFFPIAFVNAGNTGNISVISTDESGVHPRLFGWDTGPFNHFPDLLARRETSLSHDRDGDIGASGQVDPTLVRIMFERSAVTSDGANFFLIPPPKSSDPQWYRMPPELSGDASVDGRIVPLKDRMRTAEYMAAYAVMFSLTLLPPDLVLPLHYGLCGGGWENPIIAEHFKGLLAGRFDLNPVLQEHQISFQSVTAKLRGSAVCQPSLAYGYDGGAMEARLFADAAVCRVRGLPFTEPSTTGVQSACLCGTLCAPAKDLTNISTRLRQTIESSKSNPTHNAMRIIDPRFNRAIPGWK